MSFKPLHFRFILIYVIFLLPLLAFFPQRPIRVSRRTASSIKLTLPDRELLYPIPKRDAASLPWNLDTDTDRETVQSPNGDSANNPHEERFAEKHTNQPTAEQVELLKEATINSPEQPSSPTFEHSVVSHKSPVDASIQTGNAPLPKQKSEEVSAKQEVSESQPNVSTDTPPGVQERQRLEADLQLPPRLAPSLKHFKRIPNMTEPYDWTRPATLTALGIPRDDKLALAMFSTGVDLIGFGRSFTFLGCLVGNKTYPRMAEEQKSPHFCLVDPEIPAGALISYLLRRDEIIEQAIEKPLEMQGFNIENSEDDFLKLDKHVVIHDEVRELAEGYEIVTIKSHVTWHEGLREPVFNPEKKRFELCLMTAMRQYPFLLQEWFDYYRREGVDQIYVYDNVASEDLSKFDNDFVQTGFWPFGRSQQQSFNHFLLLSKNRCKYVGFFDADEYSFVGETGPNAMKRYVRKRMNEGYAQIRFPFIVMIGTGYVKRPEGFVPELYVRRSTEQKKFNVGKTVLLSESQWIRHAVHYAKGGGKYYANTSFELNPTSFEHNGMLMHYTKRSWEEHVMKKTVGGASVVTSQRPPKDFSMDRVEKYHLTNDSTVEYMTFRDRWRSIMKLPYPRDVTLSWRSNGKECLQRYCIACNDMKMGGEVTCN